MYRDNESVLLTDKDDFQCPIGCVFMSVWGCSGSIFPVLPLSRPTLEDKKYYWSC